MTERHLHIALTALAVGLATLHLPLVFRSNINWDEFRYLSVIHQHRSGTLTSALQSIHVHAFGWLPATGPNEVDQIIAGRIVYYLLLAGICCLIYFIARRFVSAAGALFAVVCYLCYREILDHATSFRFDGLAVFLLLGATALLLFPRRPRLTALLAAVLAAAALLVTLKAVFFLPTLGLVLLLRQRAAPVLPDSAPRPDPRERRMFDVVVFTFGFAAAFAALYALHRYSLHVPTVRDPSLFVREAGSRTLLPDRPFPSWPYMRATVTGNLVIWLLILHGLDSVLHRLPARETRGQALLLLTLLLPLLSLVIYRNGFPYYYVFLMPPAVILCGVSFDRLLDATRARGRISSWIPACAVAAVVASFAAHYRGADEVQIQREVVAAVHDIFPQPVTYIDRNSMIASFPKVGFFMSTWGFERYFDAGQPIFEQILRTAAPGFVLANHPALVLDSNVAMPVTRARYRLMEQDHQVLKDNFIPHWGPVFVAGKRLRVPTDAPVFLTMLIPGTYTVESVSPVRIGNLTFNPGEAVQLARGTYVVQSLARDQVLTLRWGRHLHRPEVVPPTGLLFQSL
ncbi:MAG: hypothetical protein WEF86_10270 [Gemmatimonadota bacterium]